MYVTINRIIPGSFIIRIKKFIEENSTWANFVTLIGAIVAMIVAAARFSGYANPYTFIGTVLVPISDLADGQLARRFKQETPFGSVFDKGRDKFYQITHFIIIICSFLFILSPTKDGIEKVWIILVLLAIRCLGEFLLMILAIWRSRREKKINANVWGRSKMGVDCAFLIYWAFIYDLRPFGIGLENAIFIDISLALITAGLFLSIMSAAGYYMSHS